MTRLEVPAHVRETRAAHGGAVLLDARSGHCFAMNPVARVLWQEWRRSRDFEAGVRRTAHLFPEPSRDRIREDARRLADALVRRGLLAAPGYEPATGSRDARDGAPAKAPQRTDVDVPVPADEACGPAGADIAMAAAPASPPPGAAGMPARRTLALALIGLVAALLLIRLPFRVLVRTVRWTEHHWCRREATVVEGAASLAAVRRAAALYPGRAACLETSLASLMTLALSRRRVGWCIGTALDPCRFHSWIEVGGNPVEAAGEHGSDAFRRLLQV